MQKNAEKVRDCRKKLYLCTHFTEAQVAKLVDAHFTEAQVAKLVDALLSGGSARNGVSVRL